MLGDSVPVGRQCSCWETVFLLGDSVHAYKDPLPPPKHTHTHNTLGASKGRREGGAAGCGCSGCGDGAALPRKLRLPPVAKGLFVCHLFQGVGCRG